MPELRRDPVIGRWVIIATERAKRPSDLVVEKKEFVEQVPCPFCSGNESHTPPEIFSIRQPNTKPDAPGWDVRVAPSIAPVLRIEGSLGRRGVGMYDMLNGVGAHEIIIETPEHVSGMPDLEVSQIEKVITVYIARMVDLERDPRFKYVLLFKNHGLIAGSGIVRHCRSQLIAMPVNPKRVKEKLVGAKRYFDYKERCIFCDMMKQELDAQKRIVADVDGFVAFAPFASRFPFEIWLMPKTHSADFDRMEKGQIPELARALKITLAKLKKALNDPPFNFVLHTAPFRRAKAGYWKTIEQDFHWHLEIMPRLTRVAGFEWGTGFYINPTPPEEAAKFLRELEV